MSILTLKKWRQPFFWATYWLKRKLNASLKRVLVTGGKDVPFDNFVSAEILSSIWSSQTPSWKGEIKSSWIGEGIKLEVPISLTLQKRGSL